ncbi:hypothetical protein [Acidithiobacillus sp.]|uniref:IS66 family insertion sequence element accessory protein TnpA n=1 Tax=Acidithiobacillus sp. TaxID=1872118 RepID=UPI0023278398|nr:hypothetical protein [Acidithiobacillus sp.]MDA8246765.1 hypothetical protein [Acidithiobacillus sp.]
MTKDEKIAYWRQQVERFRASGLSVKNYCAQEGIAVATLHYWRKRFADAVEPRPMFNGTEGFLPVTRKRLANPPLRAGLAKRLHWASFS